MALQGPGALQAQIKQVMPRVIASGLLVSLCTIQQPDGANGPTGGPSGNYVDVAGLVGITCIGAPLSDSSISATEMKGMEEIESKALRHVSLNADYMAATYTQPDGSTVQGIQSSWRAIVDGITFDVMGAEADSQATQTRLSLELVSI